MAKAQRGLHEAAAELAPGLGCEVQVCSGRPATEIVAFASRPGIDLVVIAGCGAGGARRLLVGSTAEEVMRLAPVPVMVLPAPVEAGEAPALPEIPLAAEPAGAGGRG